MPRKPKLPAKSVRVKEMARERVGPVPPARVLEERQGKQKPKHKKPVAADEDLRN